MLKFKKMGSDKVPLLLITANVGSIFEDPAVMLPIWTSEFLQAVSRMDPKFIALHLQEVGGKAYAKSMQYVKDFVQRLCDCPELRLFDKIRIYLDEDFSSPEKFTCKWSRKGFLRTRWMIRGTAVEFVNIHLFHDASNLVAMEPFPSVYCRSRRRALRHTLRHLHADAAAAPYFIFGDFNFRADTEGVVKKITEDLKAYRVQNSTNVDSTRLQYRSEDDRLMLTIGKKEFAHSDHQKIFREAWLQRFDRELDALRPHLYEFPVKFPPSYPFEENIELPTHYMKTRCPSWCDRVLLSQSARLLVQHQDPCRPTGEGRHLHSSRKSVADSPDSSGRASSSDSSPARSSSPAQNHQSPVKHLEKKGSVADFDALSVPGINVSRKSIADPTSVQQAINARIPEVESSLLRRKLVRNQSEGSPKLGENYSTELRRLVDAPAHRKRVEYGVIGESTCMGDHKPIYLRVMLQCDRGTVYCSCCQSALPCAVCASHLPSSRKLPLLRHPTDPDLFAGKHKLTKPPTGSYPDKMLPEDHRLLKRTRTGSLNETILRIPDVEITSADYSSYDGIFVNEVDATLLTARACVDPYTPESIDSHTPNAEDASTGSDDNEIADIMSKPVDPIRNKLTRDKSVSPTQLKSRLDMLLNSKKKSSSKEIIPELNRLNSRQSCKSGASKGAGLCCFALKCYGFCRSRARKATCRCDRCIKCCHS